MFGLDANRGHFCFDINADFIIQHKALLISRMLNPLSTVKLSDTRKASYNTIFHHLVQLELQVRFLEGWLSTL